MPAGVVKIFEFSNGNVILSTWSVHNFLKFRGVKGCEICGETRWLVLHHKDKNRRNNNFDNLMILCPNHHRQFHNGDNIIKKCEVCKKEFLVTSGQQYRPNRWCSMECRRKKEVLICPVCYKPFLIGINQKVGRRTYCSRKCQNKAMAERRWHDTCRSSQNEISRTSLA